MNTMNTTELFREEEIDFIKEMMNIGAGHAASALSQILQMGVDTIIPDVHLVPVQNMPTIVDTILDNIPNNLSSPVTCVKMGMVGQVCGELFFLVPPAQRNDLIYLAKQSRGGMCNQPVAARGTCPSASGLPAANALPAGGDSSVLPETGNIMAGVYLTAIHDVCKLNIYNTIPDPASAMSGSDLYETLRVRDSEIIMAVENEFVVRGMNIKTLFLVVPDAKSLRTLAGAIKEAKRIYGYTED